VLEHVDHDRPAVTVVDLDLDEVTRVRNAPPEMASLEA
jgi:hypothetical protein